MLSDAILDHLHGHQIHSAFRHNDVRILLARLYKLFVHWLYRVHILPDHRLKGTRPLDYIPLDPSDSGGESLPVR